MLIRLAACSLLRGKRHSALLIMFIAVCAASLCLFLGCTEYTRRGIKLGAVAQSGHAAVATDRYWEAALGSGAESDMDATLVEALEAVFAHMPVSTEKVLEFGGTLGSENRSPVYEGVMNQYNAIFGFLLVNFLVFIFVAILQSVINISLERTREFGTLRALGITRWGLAMLVMTEMIIITLLGMLLAAALVALGACFTRVLDLNYVPPMATEGFPIEFFFVTSDLLLVVVLPLFGIVVPSCLYPVIRIAGMEVTRVLEG